MDRRHFLAAAFSISLGALVLPGCGGGGGGGGRTRQVSASVALPAGSGLTPPQLTVETGRSSQPVDAGGRANATVGATPTLAWARTADAVPLLGFLGGAGVQTLSAHSTAVALLYLALGGSDIPVANAQTVLSLLESHASVTALTGVVEARVAANPKALVDGDRALADALKAALTALLADRPAHRSLRRAASRQSATPALMLIQPSALQSNVELVQGPTDQTFVATNHGRRHCQVRVYEIGTADSAGVRTDYPKARRVVDLTSLGSSKALGLLSTAWGFFSGATAFTPTSTSPIRLDMATGADKTFFQVVVLGSTTQQFEPAFFSDPRYVDELPQLRSTVLNLNLISWFTDILFGLLMELWGVRDVVASETALLAAIEAAKALQVTAWLAVVAAAEQGDFNKATQLFFKLFASDATFARDLQAILGAVDVQIAAIVGQQSTSASVQLVAKAASAAFALVGLALGAGDLGAVLWDLSHAERGDRWDLTLFQPSVVLSPSRANGAPGTRFSFSASIPGAHVGTIEFDWTQTGRFATLSSSDGKVGNAITTSANAVDLVTTASDSGFITVTVTAFVKHANGARTQIGTASAIADLTRTATTVVPATTQLIEAPVTGGPSKGKVVVYAFFLAKVPSVAWTRVHFNVHSSGGWIGTALEHTDFSQGAPVLVPGTDASTWRSYKINTNFFNLGAGTLGVTLLSSGEIDPSGVGDAKVALQKIIDRSLPAEATFE